MDNTARRIVDEPEGPFAGAVSGTVSWASDRELRRLVSVVIVSYRSVGVLGEALASVPGDVPVIVVDNEGLDASAQLAEAAGATVIR
ncbi:MAG: glycosyltransferase, partial [Pseudomonadota bacterium]